MATTTVIKGADWVVAWDEPGTRHTYLRDGDVAFEGGTITFVGKGYGGPADETIDGAGLLVLPGFVDVHSHPSTEPGFRGIREEHACRPMHMSALYERSQAFSMDSDGRRAGLEVAYAELLLSGVTSIVDLSFPIPGWLDLIAKSGIRGFVGPGFASARWRIEDGFRLAFDWDEQQGRRNFDRARALIGEAETHPSGRLSGVVYPAQIDTCTVDLLRDAYDWALEHGRPYTTHAAQSVDEFQEMVRRHGKTPLQWANDIGILGPSTLLGHAIFIDEHSWLHWFTDEDLDLLIDTGTSVAHCPTPFARYGQMLEDFGRYARAGVNLGLGTDCAPHNIIEEMRWAAVLGRIAAEDAGALGLADVLHAATVGGARALGRDDLGRLAAGARADLVLVDTGHPLMMPARDPVRSLVYTAAERAVSDVYVDGIKVVADGRVLTLDRHDALGRLAEAQARMMADTPNRDFLGRTAEEISPLSLPPA